MVTVRREANEAESRVLLMIVYIEHPSPHIYYSFHVGSALLGCHNPPLLSLPPSSLLQARKEERST